MSDNQNLPAVTVTSEVTGKTECMTLENGSLCSLTNAIAGDFSMSANTSFVLFGEDKDGNRHLLEDDKDAKDAVADKLRIVAIAQDEEAKKKAKANAAAGSSVDAAGKK